MKITEINELRKMDVISFFQYLNTFNQRLEKKIAANNKVNSKIKNRN
jgi:hypothetical protein